MNHHLFKKNKNTRIAAVILAAGLCLSGCGKKEKDYEVDYYAGDTSAEAVTTDNTASDNDPASEASLSLDDMVLMEGSGTLEEQAGGKDLIFQDGITVQGKNIDFNLKYTVPEEVDRIPTYKMSVIDEDDVKEDEIVKSFFGDSATPLNGVNEIELKYPDDEDNMVFQTLQVLVDINLSGTTSFINLNNFSSWIDEDTFFAHVYEGKYNDIDYQLLIGYSRTYKQIYVSFYPKVIGEVVGDKNIDIITATGPDGMLYTTYKGKMLNFDIPSLMADRPNRSTLSDDQLLTNTINELHNTFNLDLPEDAISLYENVYFSYVMSAESTENPNKCELLFLNDAAINSATLEGAVRNGYVVPITGQINHINVLYKTRVLNYLGADSQGGIFMVDDNGIIAIELIENYNFDEMLADNASILSFDKAMEALKTNIEKDSDLISGSNVTFENVLFMYYPVESPDNHDEYTLVPVWVVADKVQDLISNVVVVNAIDGSIIEVFHDYHY